MRVTYLEPFHGGSHAYFTRVLTAGVRGVEWRLGLLPARHWKWRMRGAGVYFAQQENLWEPVPDIVFASAFVPLADLMALRPELARIPRVLYFHENQLTYPPQHQNAPERDTHFGFTQLVSARCATCCVFNSEYNKESFLTAGRDLLRRLPDAVPKGWIEELRAKSVVIGVPLDLRAGGEIKDVARDAAERALGPIIVWNHRWEHDKNPDAFFGALRVLVAEGIAFRVIVCGEQNRRVPGVFGEARGWLGDRVVHWGYVEREEDYWALLQKAQIVVSTAHQEFFGISVMEAIAAGAAPLVPDRLSYVELLGSEWRYGSQEGLVARLRAYCLAWTSGEEDLRAGRGEVVGRFGADIVCGQFEALFTKLVEA